MPEKHIHRPCLNNLPAGQVGPRCPRGVVAITHEHYGLDGVSLPCVWTKPRGSRFVTIEPGDGNLRCGRNPDPFQQKSITPPRVPCWRARTFLNPLQCLTSLAHWMNPVPYLCLWQVFKKYPLTPTDGFETAEFEGISAHSVSFVCSSGTSPIRSSMPKQGEVFILSSMFCLTTNEI